MSTPAGRRKLEAYEDKNDNAIADLGPISIGRPGDNDRARPLPRPLPQLRQPRGRSNRAASPSPVLSLTMSDKLGQSRAGTAPR